MPASRWPIDRDLANFAVDYVDKLGNAIYTVLT